MTLTEIWKKVPGWPYEVSNMGRVRTLHRTSSTAGNNHVLQPVVSAKRYHSVALWKKGCPTQANRYVHHLVAEAFLGPRPQDHHIHHKDGDPLNNATENLEYLTPSAHRAAERELGTEFNTFPTGEDNPNAKMTPAKVRELRALREEGWGSRRLARRFGISRSTCKKIYDRVTWQHVDDPPDALQAELEVA